MNKALILSGIVNALLFLLAGVSLFLSRQEIEFYFYTATAFGAGVILCLLINFVLSVSKLIKREFKDAVGVIVLTVLTIIISFFVIEQVPMPTV